MQNADLKLRLKPILDALGEVSVKGYQNRIVLATCEQNIMALLRELDNDAALEAEEE